MLFSFKVLLLTIVGWRQEKQNAGSLGLNSLPSPEGKPCPRPILRCLGWHLGWPMFHSDSGQRNHDSLFPTVPILQDEHTETQRILNHLLTSCLHSSQPELAFRRRHQSLEGTHQHLPWFPHSAPLCGISHRPIPGTGDTERTQMRAWPLVEKTHVNGSKIEVRRGWDTREKRFIYWFIPPKDLGVSWKRLHQRRV